MSASLTPAESIPLSRRVRELELMVRVSRTLTSTLDTERLLHLISKTAAELVGCVDASIILEDQRTGELTFLAASGPKSEDLKHVRIPIEGSIAGTVFKNREPLIVQDTATDPRHYEKIDHAIEFETQSILAVPMMFKDRAIGVLEAINKLDGGEFSDNDVQILSTLAAQAAVALENARLVSELQEANAQLAELDRLKSDFIGIASHELRTPLSLILGYATFLREDVADTAGEQLDAVLQAATQLKSIIEAMVNLTHLEAGSAALDLSEISLQEVIRERVDAQRQFAATKSLEMRTRLPEKPMHVHADRDKISVVLDNLINNAIKYTPAGGRIQVAIHPQTEMVAVSVADTGIGIREQEVNRIFDRFFQVESHLTRIQGGMGLGLSVARGMVELHGGHIWVESVEGQGSRFTFTLPVLWKDAAA